MTIEYLATVANHVASRFLSDEKIDLLANSDDPFSAINIFEKSFIEDDMDLLRRGGRSPDISTLEEQTEKSIKKLERDFARRIALLDPLLAEMIYSFSELSNTIYAIRYFSSSILLKEAPDFPAGFLPGYKSADQTFARSTGLEDFTGQMESLSHPFHKPLLLLSEGVQVSDVEYELWKFYFGDYYKSILIDCKSAKNWFCMRHDRIILALVISLRRLKPENVARFYLNGPGRIKPDDFIFMVTAKESELRGRIAKLYRMEELADKNIDPLCALVDKKILADLYREKLLDRSGLFALHYFFEGLRIQRRDIRLAFLSMRVYAGKNFRHVLSGVE